jgi:hypothetical protein
MGDPGALSRVPSRRSSPSPPRGRSAQRRGRPFTGPDHRAAGRRVRDARGPPDGARRRPGGAGSRVRPGTASRGSPGLSRRGARPRRAVESRVTPACVGGRAGTRAVVVTTFGTGLRWSPSSVIDRGRLGTTGRLHDALGRGSHRRGSGPPAPAARAARRFGRGLDGRRRGSGPDGGAGLDRDRQASRTPPGRRGRCPCGSRVRPCRCRAPSTHRLAGTQAGGGPGASDRAAPSPLSPAASPR